MERSNLSAPSGSSDEELEEEDADVSFAERSLRESIRARENVLSNSYPSREAHQRENILENETFDDSGDISFASQASNTTVVAPQFLLRSPTKQAESRTLLGLKPTTSKPEDAADDFNQLEDMLNQWSTPQMVRYLGDEDVVEDVRTYQTRKKQQEDEEIDRLEAKMSNLWKGRQSRLQKHLQVIREKEEEERKRIQREEEERLRLIEEENERLRLEKEKAAAEAKRAAEEKKQRQLEAAEAKRKAAEAAAAKKEAEEAEAAKKSQEAAESAAASEAAAAAAEAEKQKGTSETAFSDWDAIEKEFQTHKTTIADIKTSILAPVSASKELKSVCFQAKRKIKPKLGQLTDSKSHLQTLFAEIVRTVEECQNMHELVYMWILNFFSKSLIAQAEAETTVSIQSALPLGTLAAMMMVRFKELPKLLIARFVKKCPMVIGYSCAIDTEEGRLRMGWKRSSSEGKWEDPTQYSERLAGICAVWTVLTTSKIDTPVGQPHPYPISNSWRFLARLTNMKVELLSNVHYAVVAVWWDIAGKVFAEAYGKQGIKLLSLIWGPWTQLVLDQRLPAALRLGLLGEDWQNSGQLKSLHPMGR